MFNDCNKKGFTTLTMVFVVGFFIMVWSFLAGWINETMDRQVALNNLTGLEAWILGNFNFTIFLALLMFIVAYTYMGGGEG